ncbi:MAG TPA: DUF3090 family protein [Dehalococcoidia bacterium]|nr:DUF3090 family protein [Dehalococcoidia bacterium]
MTGEAYELDPVQAITASAVGEPGHRVFYLQARTQEATVTLVAEKAQVVVLAHGIYQLLAEIGDKYPATNQSAGGGPLDLELHAPLEPDFRVERLELGYDPQRDLVVLVAYELIPEEPDAAGQPLPDAPSMARFYATRDQMRALADHALEVAAEGRPVCALCGQPQDPEGHVCPRRNGHPPG